MVIDYYTRSELALNTREMKRTVGEGPAAARGSPRLPAACCCPGFAGHRSPAQRCAPVDGGGTSCHRGTAERLTDRRAGAVPACAPAEPRGAGRGFLLSPAPLPRFSLVLIQQQMAWCVLQQCLGCTVSAQAGNRTDCRNRSCIYVKLNVQKCRQVHIQDFSWVEGAVYLD